MYSRYYYCKCGTEIDMTSGTRNCPSCDRPVCKENEDPTKPSVFEPTVVETTDVIGEIANNAVNHTQEFEVFPLGGNPYYVKGSGPVTGGQTRQPGGAPSSPNHGTGYTTGGFRPAAGGHTRPTVGTSPSPNHGHGPSVGGSGPVTGGQTRQPGGAPSSPNHGTGYTTGGFRPGAGSQTTQQGSVRGTNQRSFDQIAEMYGRSGDSRYIHDAFASFDIRTVTYLNMENIWRPFFIKIAGFAIDKGDKVLQSFLKTQAKDYDTIKGGGSDLYYRLFSACPQLLSNNDWMGMIRETNGDTRAFSKICEPLVRYVAQTKDRAFAVDVFKKLTKLSKKDAHWNTVREDYARALFSSEDISESIFTKSIFLKNGEARKFAKYCKSRLRNIVSIEDSKVWENYTAAIKIRKGLMTAAVFAVLAAIAAGLIAFYMYLSDIDRDTVSFTVDKIIEVTYGEKISLDGYYLTYKTHKGDEGQQSLNESMLFGYDPEKVGSQQSAYFEFYGVQKSVTIIVKSTQLEKPKLTQSGNYISWETIPNADSYAIFVNASEVKTAETTGLRYDLSETAAFGTLTVTVRAVSSTGKYLASEMSDPITVTKLEAPKNIEFSSGKLTWSAVEGATGYELTVNGVPYIVSDPECTLSLNRGYNDVRIIATSEDKSVIPGVTTKPNMYYDQLDPITSMTYREGILSWVASEDAKIFRVYVDGVHWKDFSRNYFSYETDGFKESFGSGEYKIEIVCMTSATGVDNSEMAGYKVSFGNKATMDSGLISWNDLGKGATYFVYVNDVLYTYSAPYFSTNDCAWQSGNNVVSIIAKLNGEEYICESFIVKKHTAPTISVTDKGWVVGNSGYELYSVNGSAWTKTLPDVSSIVAGTHSISVKRTVSAPDAFEIESEITQITISKPNAPVIRLNMGAIECSVFDSAVLDLVLEYYDAEISSWVSISSVDAIIHAGEYRIRAYFRAKANTGDYDFYLSSDRSAEIHAVKPKAPNVVYDAVAGQLSSTTYGARFYYLDENGKEHEIPEGKVFNLPGGVFKVYARLNATDSTMLNSQNTPLQEQVSVFNLDIEFMVTPISGSNQCYLLFSGCNEVDEITYSFKINYLDDSNQVIGGLDRSYSFVTQGKLSAESDTIACLINYRTGGLFNGNYTQSDVAQIEVIVYIDGGTEKLQKSYTVSVK